MTVHRDGSGVRIGGLSSGLTIKIVISEADGALVAGQSHDMLPYADQMAVDEFIKAYMVPMCSMVINGIPES